MRDFLYSSCKLRYSGDVKSGSTSRARADALERLGFDVTVVDTSQSPGEFAKIDRRTGRRWQIGWGLTRFNRKVAPCLSTGTWDLLWVDRGWSIRPRLVKAAKRSGVVTVTFINDNPRGSLGQKMWRHLLDSLRCFEVVLSPRLSTVDPYSHYCVEQDTLIKFGFDPIRHRPHEHDGLGHGVCFIGATFKDGIVTRFDLTTSLKVLSHRLHSAFSRSGHGWERLGQAQLADFRDAAGPKVSTD